MPHVRLNSKFCRPDKSAYYRQTICLTNRQDHSRFDNVKGFPEKTEKPEIAVTAALVYVPGCTVLSELLCVVEADPAVTLASKGLQQPPLRCALARCLRNNGEHTPASETTGAVIRAGAFADTKTVGGHPNRVRLEGSADGIDSPAILSEHKITGILVRTRLCVTEVTERPLLGCGIDQLFRTR